MLTFTVNGKPAAQGSKRHVGHGVLVESSKALAPWRDSVVAAAHQAAAEQSWPCATGAVAVSLSFWFVRPKSARRPYPSVAPDLDKLARAVGDALTIARVVHDDALIVDMVLRKRYALGADMPGLVVAVQDAASAVSTGGAPMGLDAYEQLVERGLGGRGVVVAALPGPA